MERNGAEARGGKRGGRGGRRWKNAAWSVRVLVFLFGFGTLLAQVLLLREFLAVVGGIELMLALFYAAWFLGIFIGGLASVAIGPRATPRWRLAPALQTLQLLWVPVGLGTIRLWREATEATAGVPLSFGAAAAGVAVAVVPFGLLTGFLFPLLCGIWKSPPGAAREEATEANAPVEKSEDENAEGMEEGVEGGVYAVDSLGGLAAGCLFAFVLVEWLTPLQCACFAAAATALAGAWVLMGRSRARAQGDAPGLLRARTRSSARSRTDSILALGFLVLAVALAFAPRASFVRKADAWSESVRWRSIAGSLDPVASRSTRYQRIDLGLHDEQYTLFLDGQVAYSFPDPRAAAVEAHTFLAQAPGARRVLLIGGAFAGMVEELLRHPAVVVECVELDPGVAKIVEPRMAAETRAALDDPRATLHWIDGRTFVKREGARVRRGERPPYDLVVSLAPDPVSAAHNRSFTADFFEEIRSLLAPDGVFATRIGSAVNYYGRDVMQFTGTVYATLASRFGHVLATPGETALLFASDDRLTSSPVELAARYRASGVESPRFNPLHFRMTFDPWHTEEINRALAADVGKTALNTDARPVAYLFGLLLWGRFSGSRTDGVFRAIARVEPKHVFGAVGALLVAGWLGTVGVRPGARASRRRRRRNARIVALGVLASSGLTGIGLSLAILFAFQNTYGYVYREIGLLSGLFMAGLAAGGYAFRRPPRFARPKTPRTNRAVLDKTAVNPVNEVVEVKGFGGRPSDETSANRYNEKARGGTSCGFHPEPSADCGSDESSCSGTGFSSGVVGSDASRRAFGRLAAWECLFALGILGILLAMRSLAGGFLTGLTLGIGGVGVLGGLAVLAGFLSGAEFPLIGHLQRATGLDLARRAAWLTSFDHLGAAAGSLLTGLVLVPVLGLTTTLLFFAFVKLAAAAWLLGAGHRAGDDDADPADSGPQVFGK